MTVHLKMDGHGKFKFEHVRQFLYELKGVSLFLSMIIFNGPGKLIEKVNV